MQRREASVSRLALARAKARVRSNPSRAKTHLALPNPKKQKRPGGRLLDIQFSRNWSGRRDSNPRPQPWQGCALPLSYTRIHLAAPRFVGGQWRPFAKTLGGLQHASACALRKNLKSFAGQHFSLWTDGCPPGPSAADADFSPHRRCAGAPRRGQVRWMGSIHFTVVGFSTGSMSRLTTTGSWPERTSTHSSTSSGEALIS